MKKFLAFIIKHKVIAFLIVTALAGGGYWGYKKWFTSPATVRYITTAATRAALTTTVSGTGQVSMSDQVDVKPKASGDVIALLVKPAQEVKTGQVLARLDATGALKSVRDAATNLETARLALEKLKQPATDLEILQSENSLAAAIESKQQSEMTLAKSYDDGFNTVSAAFMDLPTILTGLQSMLYGSDFPNTTWWNIDWYVNQGVTANYDARDQTMRYREEVNAAYQAARKSYDASFVDYKAATRFSSTSTIETLIIETYNTMAVVSEAVKSANNFIDYIQDLIGNTSITLPTLVSTHQSSLDNFISTTNSDLMSLLSAKNTISNAKTAIISAGRSIAEKTASLANLKADVDPLDLRSQEIALAQKQNAMADAQSNLADYTVRAPFDGIMATVDTQVGGSASAGSSIGTLITKHRIASITLNEVDVAKVKVGQKAILTFDAIDGLSITGEVAQIDSLGAVSQGVVSYGVKITFDVQDDRIKGGMSVSANIILSSKPNIIMVPSAAVKNQNGESYVQVLVNGAPQKQVVTVGESNDTMIEIVSGVNESDAVVTQTITTGGATTATTNNNAAAGGANALRGAFQLGGGGGGPGR